MSLPIYWQRTKKTTELLSMNNYRNWHHHTSSKCKREYSKLVTDKIPEGCPTFKQYVLKVDIYYQRANTDPSNVIPIVEKFFLDALISAGILAQDSMTFHLGTQWQVAGQDKINPRCEITVEEVVI